MWNGMLVDVASCQSTCRENRDLAMEIMLRLRFPTNRVCIVGTVRIPCSSPLRVTLPDRTAAHLLRHGHHRLASQPLPPKIVPQELPHEAQSAPRMDQDQPQRLRGRGAIIVTEPRSVEDTRSRTTSKWYDAGGHPTSIRNAGAAAT